MIASQTSKGAWVPIPCTRSAESRQITPCGARRVTSASDRCSLRALPGRPYTPRAILSSLPAATSRLSTMVGSPFCARSFARSSGVTLASSRTVGHDTPESPVTMGQNTQSCCEYVAFYSHLSITYMQLQQINSCTTTPIPPPPNQTSTSASAPASVPPHTPLEPPHHHPPAASLLAPLT